MNDQFAAYVASRDVANRTAIARSAKRLKRYEASPPPMPSHPGQFERVHR